MSVNQKKHHFKFRVMGPDGEAHTIVHKARVRTPKQTVRVPIKALYAYDALEAEACGNTQHCTVSTAITKNKRLFDHPVLGIVDFHYRTCFIASKRNKEGVITECYRYLHSDNIAQRNDTPGGLKKLLKDLEENGDQLVTLRPRLRTDRTKDGGTGRRTGERSSQAGPRGAARRYAVALGGAFPGLRV